VHGHGLPGLKERIDSGIMPDENGRRRRRLPSATPGLRLDGIVGDERCVLIDVMGFGKYAKQA